MTNCERALARLAAALGVGLVASLVFNVLSVHAFYKACDTYEASIDRRRAEHMRQTNEILSRWEAQLDEMEKLTAARRP